MGKDRFHPRITMTALDPLDKPIKDELQYWKERCEAAEKVIEKILDEAYKKTWLYKKWLSIKNKKT